MRPIDADTLFKMLLKTKLDGLRMNVSAECLADAMLDVVTDFTPTIDAVPVVRCKDCKHAPREEIIDGGVYIIEPKDKDGTTDSTCPYVCMDWYYTEVPDGDSFCNKGELKDGEQDA